MGILDSTNSTIHYGSSVLLDRLKSINPKMHLFGHTHDAYGTTRWNGITFSNAAVTDDLYNISHSPRLLEY